ncbi:MAG: PQQ-dependent sugar dehydrogenase [Saprospiraceae bacterium]
MKTIFTLLLLCSQFFLLPAQISLSVDLISNAFSVPVDIATAGDERLFIVEKDARIRILHPDGQVNEQSFLDIDDRVGSNGSERGLLGLAFHPDYSENGYFFVYYTNNSGNSVVSRFEVSAGNPDQADPESEKILLTVPQPFANHNGGDLNFGPDGYLYISLGDGGSGGDPNNNGQNRLTLLGTILRIDIDNGDPYAIPDDNPFAEDDATLDEIWALGLRNPWRFSFDRLTGDMWIGDVGQEKVEEIDFQPAGSPGGINYGWRCYEGNITFNTSNCGPSSDYQFPIFTYESNLPIGCSVNGGFVYRGATYPLMYGKYLFSDYCSGKIWALSQTEAEEWVSTELYDGSNYSFSAMGEDHQGEIYIASINGGIYQLRDQTTGTTEHNTLDVRLAISPNPFDQVITVSAELPENGRYRLRLVNALGQVVWEESAVYTTLLKIDIPTRELPAGMYSFQMERNGKLLVRKVLKQ